MKLNICVIKNSNAKFFKTIKEMKLTQYWKLRYIDRFQFLIEKILNFLSIFIDIEIYNLMPQYGYYPSRIKDIHTIFWDAAHLGADSLPEHQLLNYNRGLDHSKQLHYFFHDNLNELNKINPNLIEKSKKINFAANFRTVQNIQNSERDIDIIYVASTQKRKNIDHFTEIVSEVTKILPTIKVALVGNHEKPKTQNICVYTNLTEEELVSLYSRSKLFLNTSNCEGLGLPNLEAKFLGCSVICNDIAIFREVMGTDAEYISTSDILRASKYVASKLKNYNDEVNVNDALNYANIDKYLDLNRLEIR